jgi:hypothetical protein
MDVMRQVFRTLTLAAAVVAASQGSLDAATGAKDAIAEARKQIASKDLQAAAETLEDALGGSGGDDRKAILGLLKQTYRDLIQEARTAGKSQAADLFAENLAILDAQPAPAGAESAPGKAPATAPEPAQPPAAVDPPPASPTTPTTSPIPKSDARLEPASGSPRIDRPIDANGFPEPSAAPAPKDLPALRAPAESPRAFEPPSPTPTKNPAPAPAPIASTDDIPAPTPSRPVRQDPGVAAEDTPRPSRARAAIPPPVVSSSKNLAAADALFNQKRYEEAGKLYAALAAQNRLPAERKKIWAYCRLPAVVARINDRPRSGQEWDEIEKEIKSIQVLTPGQDGWYCEYLKECVAAARRGERPPARSKGLVVRGATPEEPEPEPNRTPQAPADPRARRAGGEEPLRLPSSSGDEGRADAPTPSQDPSAGRISTASAPEWQVHETASFRIFHTDPALAEQAAEAAEAVRARQGTRWGSRAVHSTWSPRCDIYLYPTARDFARMTGQPETSPGFSTMGVSGGQIVARRVNLRADHPQVLSAILPHEVTHVVLADVFNEQQIPRWADEGMAVLAEPAAEQAGRASDLSAPLTERRVFQLGQLMSIDYPEAKHWSLFYAQSVSLTRFLVGQGTPAQFVAFIKSSQRQGADAALREVYKIEGLADLETRWRDFAVQQASQLATADASPQAATDEPQRQ